MPKFLGLYARYSKRKSAYIYESNPYMLYVTRRRLTQLAGIKGVSYRKRQTDDGLRLSLIL